MSFYPRNKYLSVAPVESTKSETTSGFVLPDDYQKQEETHTVVRLMKSSGDSTYYSSEWGNTLLLVPTNMLEKVKIGFETFWIVPESAVCGIVEE